MFIAVHSIILKLLHDTRQVWNNISIAKVLLYFLSREIDLDPCLFHEVELLDLCTRIKKKPLNFVVVLLDLFLHA